MSLPFLLSRKVPNTLIQLECNLCAERRHHGTWTVACPSVDWKGWGEKHFLQCAYNEMPCIATDNVFQEKTANGCRDEGEVDKKQ